MCDDIDEILLRLEGTREYEILYGMKEIYSDLENLQAKWYKDTGFSCPSGCGTCCNDFEPDLFEAEALYLAAWLLQNQKEKAFALASGTFTPKFGKTCILFDEKSQFHCTCYNGRAFICRLFGGSCVKDKDGNPCWRPCKFYPDDMLLARKIPVEHREYSVLEAETVFGSLPPVMSDITARALGFTPENQRTESLRVILPKKIRQLITILDYNGTTLAG